MKKQLIRFTSVLAIAAVAIVGCKKKFEAVVTSDLGTFTITGTVLADLDFTNDTNAAGNYRQSSNPEPIQGVRVWVSINYINLDQTPNGGSNQYKEEIIATTTDANGNYTLSIPAGDNPYNVTVNIEDVTRDQIQADDEANNIGTILRRFFGDDFTVSNIHAGGSQTAETLVMSYSSVNNTNDNTEDDMNETGTFKLSGTLRLEQTIAAGDTVTDTNSVNFRDDTTVFEFVPSGTVITFRVYSYISSDDEFNEYITTTVGANGAYSIDIPTSTLENGGSSSYEIIFPELLLTYTDNRDENVSEQKVFEVVSNGSINYPLDGVSNNPSTDGSANFGGFELERDYYYTQK